MRRARGLLAGSQSSLDAYLTDYDLPHSKTALARHGIDIHFFKPIGDTGVLRERLGIGKQEFVLIFSGFFTERKGLLYLAEALKRIDPPPRLVLTGRWDESFRRRFYDRLGPLEKTVIEAGFVPDAEMPAFFSMADLYVSPSLLEGFGLPIAEALACGTPAVGFEAGSVAEVMGPGGTLVAPKDVAALAREISRLRGDAAARRDLAALGRQHVLENFSVERMVADVLSGYAKFG